MPVHALPPEKHPSSRSRGGGSNQRIASQLQAATTAPRCSRLKAEHVENAVDRSKRRKACASAACLSSSETRPGSGAFCGFPRDKKRLGARGSAWPCVSETAAAARHGSRLVALRQGWFRSGLVRACLSILELCEWFRDSSQASGASQRVQRASDALPLIGRCGGWPCTPWPSRGRSRIVALLCGRLSLA